MWAGKNSTTELLENTNSCHIGIFGPWVDRIWKNTVPTFGFAPLSKARARPYRDRRLQGRADTGWAFCGGRKQGHAGDGEGERYPIIAHGVNSQSLTVMRNKSNFSITDMSLLKDSDTTMS